MNYFSSGWGHGGALRALLSPRGAFAPRLVRGNIVITAARAGLCVALPLVVLYLAARMDLAPYAAMGCFTALYARDDTYARRSWILAVVGTTLTLAVAVGGVAAALNGDGWARVLVVAAVAAGAKYLSDALALGPPAGLMFVFAAGVAAYTPQTLAALPVVVSTTLAAAALCWTLAMVGVLLHPRAPERLAVGRAVRAVADHLRAPSPARRQGAEQRLRRAWQVLHTARRTPLLHTLEVLTARAQVQLPGSGSALTDARNAAQLTELAGRVRRARVLDALVDPDEHALFTRYADRLRQGAGAATMGSWSGRGRALVSAPRGAGVWVVRVALACLVAGFLAWALGLGHGYWAAVSAASVLQATNVTTTWHRTLQRAGGTVVGVLVAAALFSVLDMTSVLVVIVLVVACQVGAELVVMTNYSYAIVCVTPLTLALSFLVQPEVSATGLAWERLAATVLGAVIGVLAGLVVVNRRAVSHLEEAVAECERACVRLERVRGRGAGDGVDESGGSQGEQDGQGVVDRGQGDRGRQDDQGMCEEHREREDALARHRLGRALATLDERAAVVAGELAGATPEQVGRVRERARALLEG